MRTPEQRIIPIIRRELEAQNLSMSRLAKLAKVDHGGLSRFLNYKTKGTISFEFVRRLFHALEISMRELD